MRLTLFIEALKGGGAERVLSEMASHWAARQHTVQLLTRTPPESDFYRVHPAVGRVMVPRPVSPLGQTRRYLLRVRALREALAASRPDVIISFIDTSNIETLLAAHDLGIPVIVSERCDPDHNVIPLHHSILRRLLYPHADMVVVQTESVRRWAEKFLWSERVAVVPNCVRQPAPAPPVAREPVIVAMGRLVEQKGFDLLVAAFARVARALPGWRLIIVGDGERRAALERQVAALGLGDRIALPGVTSDAQSFLRRAGMFVLSSRFEGFPNVLLEAMACGTPVVAMDCPSGPRDIVRPGHDGLLVPVDVDALAAAILQLGRAPDQRARLGANAVDVTARFHPDRIMAMWDDLCHRARDNARPTATGRRRSVA
jgi:glycosyltransferase involved in cell wall biosynthesis